MDKTKKHGHLISFFEIQKGRSAEEHGQLITADVPE